MSNPTIYAGTSVFFKNRSGSHNWLEKTTRPMLNIVKTQPDGSRVYTDVFANQDVLDVKVLKNGKVQITFEADTSKPLFRVLDMKTGRTHA